MRITAGTYRNRRLKTPKSMDIRPATDKVRQAVFNMLLAYDLPVDAHVIDGFCGTGSYGLEALSRGAATCTFIDQGREAIAICHDNIRALSCDDQSTVIAKNITALRARPDKDPSADLIFLDPPYGKNLLSPAIDALLSGNWASEKTVFVIEHGKKDTFTHPALTLEKERLYGDICIKIMQKA